MREKSPSIIYEQLAKRFLSDKNLPYQYIDYNHFLYCIHTFGGEEDWNNLLDYIHKNYGSPGKFLDDYYLKRDEVIKDILANPDYALFNSMDMSKFELDKESRSIPQNNIYNRENVGHVFLSIDLKKGNFQVMRHLFPSIVHNKDTYEEFIGCFTDMDYIKESKYTRQVIFGKTNPKRQITCMKFFVNEIRKKVEKTFDLAGLGWELVSLQSDEIVYRHIDIMEFLGGNWTRICEDIPEFIRKETGFDVHLDMFELQGFEFRSDGSDKCHATFYKKKFMDATYKLKQVPMPYHKLIYKMLNEIPLSDGDYLFDYEGIISSFMEEFEIKEIKQQNNE